MCRLAAFPPGFPRDAAVCILKSFSVGNDDGTGYAFVHNGEFVVKKWAHPLKRVLKRNHDFLGHMPYTNGWTIAHLRAASHGAARLVNTHPFIKGESCVVHNGIWSEYSVASAALEGVASFEGQTDSEVAAYLINKLGPKRAYKVIDRGGVFLDLKKTGELWILKTSGILDSIKIGDTALYASELPNKLDSKIVDDGWIRLRANGTLISRRVASSWSYAAKDEYEYEYSGYSTTRGGCGRYDKGNGRSMVIPESAIDMV